MDKLVLRYRGTKLQETDGCDVFKIWEDLFLSQEEQDYTLLEGIQSEDVNKIGSGARDKKTSGVDVEQ